MLQTRTVRASLDHSLRRSVERQIDRRLSQACRARGRSETIPTVRRELASAAIRLADKHDVTPLLRALMAHKEDAKDPVIPQLVWLAYEKVLASRRA